MSNQSPGRGERIVPLVIDWIIVLGLIFGGLGFIGVSGALNLFVLIALLAIIILVPVVYFKVIKWAIGMTLGRVIVIGLDANRGDMKSTSRRL